MAEKFVGRQWELEHLQDLWNHQVAQFVVIKGRRRIGKSRLVKEFSERAGEQVRFVSLSGLPPTDGITAQHQRDDFARQLARSFHVPTPYSQDWGDLFWHLAHHTRTGKTIILLDEISWMGMKDPTFLGKLKNAWDQDFKQNSQLILILCGSVSSWIEDNILKNTGFVGRIDSVLTLEELSLVESKELLGKTAQSLSPFEIFKILSVTGGVPRYLESVVPQYSAEENIKRLCFTKGGLLFREFDQIFHDLFSSKNTVYRDILEALLQTPHADLDHIFQHLDKEKSGTISKYLLDLNQAGFVTRYHTWNLKTAAKSKLSQYRISDNYVRFYLRYIQSLRDKIERGDFQDRSLASLPAWNTLMGLQFENLVLKNRKHLHKILKINPDEIVQDGPYFQRPTTKNRGCQIDYLIQTRYNGYTIVEIKFSKDPIGTEVVSEMRDKIQALNFSKQTSCRPVLIHINGVEDSLIGEEIFAQFIDFSEFLT